MLRTSPFGYINNNHPSRSQNITKETGQPTIYNQLTKNDNNKYVNNQTKNLQSAFQNNNNNNNISYPTLKNYINNNSTEADDFKTPKYE